MYRLGLLALCACGRFGFEPTGGSGTGTGAGGDSGDGNGVAADAFVRGDVSFTNNIAFVSDPIVTPGLLGTAAAGDAACQTAAEAAGLPGTYVAWLSTTSSNAIDRIAGARGWVRADGLPLFDQPSDLVAGRLLSPLVVDATGTQIPSTAVATGTRPNGTAMMNCTDLSTPSGLIDSGIPSATSAEWTYIGYSWSPCNAPQRLYCMGTGSTAPLVIPAQTARRAFLSVTLWGSGGGLASADAACQAEATAASLPGASTFRALLATSSASAASRFMDGLPWMRVDGMLVADTAQDLFAMKFRVPLNVHADGTHSTDTGSGAVGWLGAPTPTAVGTMTCADWSVSNNGQSGTTLNHVRIDPGTSMAGCGGTYPLFCLEP